MTNKLKTNYKGTPFGVPLVYLNDILITINDSFLIYNSEEIIKLNGNEVE